jgi:hypothetical protein
MHLREVIIRTAASPIPLYGGKLASVDYLKKRRSNMGGMPTGLLLQARWDEYFGLLQVQEDASRLCPFPTSARPYEYWQRNEMQLQHVECEPSPCLHFSSSDIWQTD